jgi:hypothetical protein
MINSIYSMPNDGRITRHSMLNNDPGFELVQLCIHYLDRKKYRLACYIFYKSFPSLEIENFKACSWCLFHLKVESKTKIKHCYFQHFCCTLESIYAYNDAHEENTTERRILISLLFSSDFFLPAKPLWRAINWTPSFPTQIKQEIVFSCGLDGSFNIVIFSISIAILKTWQHEDNTVERYVKFVVVFIRIFFTQRLCEGQLDAHFSYTA